MKKFLLLLYIFFIAIIFNVYISYEIGFKNGLKTLSNEIIASDKELQKRKELDDKIITITNNYSKGINELLKLLYLKDVPVIALEKNTIKNVKEAISFLEEKEYALDTIKKYLYIRKDFVENFPVIYPVRVGTTSITSGFGYRENVLKGQGGSDNTTFHAGVDLKVPYGSDVIATVKGKVLFTQKDHELYGRLIILESEDKNILIYYAHLSKIDLRINQPVSRGDVIGKTGNSGHSNGPHLHYEIRIKEEPVDPYIFLGMNY